MRPPYKPFKYYGAENTVPLKKDRFSNEVDFTPFLEGLPGYDETKEYKYELDSNDSD